MHTWADPLSTEHLQLPKLKECLSAVDILKDIGPSSCCDKVNHLHTVLKELLPLSEGDVMSCLIYMANHIQVYSI